MVPEAATKVQPTAIQNKSPIYKKKSIDVSPIYKRNSQVSISQSGLPSINAQGAASPQANSNSKRSDTSNLLKKRSLNLGVISKEYLLYNLT